MRLFIGVQWRAPIILIIHVGCFRHCWRCWISASPLLVRCCVFSSFTYRRSARVSRRSQPADERCVIAQWHSSYGERDDKMPHHARCVFYLLECSLYSRATHLTHPKTHSAAATAAPLLGARVKISLSTTWRENWKTKCIFAEERMDGVWEWKFWVKPIYHEAMLFVISSFSFLIPVLYKFEKWINFPKMMETMKRLVFFLLCFL